MDKMLVSNNVAKMQSIDSMCSKIFYEHIIMFIVLQQHRNINVFLSKIFKEKALS